MAVGLRGANCRHMYRALSEAAGLQEQPERDNSAELGADAAKTQTERTGSLSKKQTGCIIQAVKAGMLMRTSATSLFVAG